MKQKTFFIVFEGLSFGEKIKFDKKLRTQALSKEVKDQISEKQGTVCWNIYKDVIAKGIKDCSPRLSSSNDTMQENYLTAWRNEITYILKIKLTI